MNKQAVKEFFDRLASGWDAGMVRSDEHMYQVVGQKQEVTLK